MPWELPITIEDTTYPVRFNTEAEPTQADIDEAVAYITQQRTAPTAPAAPPDSGQGRTTSFLSSVGRGAASIVPGVIGGAGYLTGSEALTGAAESIEAGINRALPVNPAYEGEFLMKAGQALGQVVPMIGTGGVAGAVGKSMALARGLEAGAAAAKGTQLAGRVMLGSGMLQGTRGGGQAAEQYGMEGGAAYARALLGGAIEGATEKYMFGMGTELSPIKKLIGDALDKGAAGIAKAATIEGAEEGAAEFGGNVLNKYMAPSGVETPGLLAGVGESAALGAVAGGAIGGFNAALGGEETLPVEGVPVVEPPAPIQEEERLDVESAVEKVISSLESEIASGTLTQKPDETGEAFIGRLNTQTEELARRLETAATKTVKANAEVLPATTAVLAAEAPATVETPKEMLDQTKARLRTKLSAEERAAMEERLKQVEDEGVLADVFAEERQRATAREDAQRRLRELDAERARLEQEIATQETPVGALEPEASGVLLPEDAVAEDQSQNEPTPIVEETVPPEQPVPAVEEAVAAKTEPAPEEASDRLMDVSQAMQFLYGKGLTKTDREKAQKLIEKNEREARKTGKIQGARSFYESEIEAAVEEVLAQKQTSSEFRKTLERARANKEASQGLSSLVDALDVAEATLKEIESDRGMYGVQWAEKNVRRRATMQKAKIRDLKERIVAIAPSVKKAPTPSLPQDQFQKTENVVAPAGEAGVGLGMEEPTVLTETTSSGKFESKREVTQEGVDRVEAAKTRLREVMNNPDIVGRQRADMIANGKNLISFLETNADTRKPLETDYVAGDQVAFTGEDAPEGFRAFIYLEGAKAGASGVTLTKEEKAKDVERSQREFKEQQAGMKRVRDTGKSDQMPKAKTPAAQAPAFKEAPTLPLPEDQFQKTENVVAPAGEAEVGLGMEEKAKSFKSELEMSGVAYLNGDRWGIKQSSDGIFYVEQTVNGERKIVASNFPDIETARVGAINAAFPTAVESTGTPVTSDQTLEAGRIPRDSTPAQNDSPTDKALIKPVIRRTGSRVAGASVAGQQIASANASRIATLKMLNDAVGAYPNEDFSGIDPSQINEVMDYMISLQLPQTPAAQAPAFKKAPTPPLPEDQFQKTENVVAPAGEAGVGLGMEEPKKARPMNTAGQVRPEKKSRALPTFTPAPKEPFKPSAERFAQFYIDADIPEATAVKNAAKLMEAIETGKWTNLLHPDNKKSRAIWETWTRTKLPKGVAASEAAFYEFMAEYRAKTFTTPASDLSDAELEAEILRIAEQGMKPTASQVLKDRALELSKEYQSRQDAPEGIYDNKAAPQDRRVGEQSPAVSSKGQIQPEGDKQNVEKESKESQAEESGPTVASAAQAPTPEPAPPAKPAAEVETGVAGVPAAEVNAKMEELLRAPTKATGKPAVKFKTQTEENAFRRGFQAAVDKPGAPPPADRTGLSPKDRKWDDAWRTGWAQGQTFIRAKIPTAEFGDSNTLTTKAEKDEAVKSLRKKLGGQTNVGLDPSILKDALAIAAFYFEGGDARLPLNAAAVDAYQIPLPEGYTRQGELYGYQPKAPSPPAAEVETPVAGVPAEVDQEIDAALTPQEKQEAAEDLGQPTWNAEAKKSFREAYADWLVTIKSATARLAKIFAKLASKVKTLLLGGIVAVSTQTGNTTFVDVPVAKSFGPVLSEVNAKDRSLGDLPPAAMLPVSSVTGQRLSVGTLKTAKKANFKGARASSPVVATADWVVGSNDAKGRPFILGDKLGGRIYVFNAEGTLVRAESALFGMDKGDELNEGKVTPSGRFEATIDPDANNEYNYGKTLDFLEKEDSVLAVHRIYHGVPSQNRAGRLASKSPVDNRISSGCVNVTDSLFDKVIDPLFSETGGIVYILPETAKGRAEWHQLVEFGDSNTLTTKAEKDEAVKSLRKKLGGQTNVGLDPSILKDALAIAAFYFEGGARSFTDFSAAMIKDFGVKVKPYLRAAYEALRKRTDIDTAGMDPEEGGESAPKAPETPKPKGDITLNPSEIEVIPEDMARAEADKAANNERWQKASVSTEPVSVLRRLDGTYKMIDGHHRLLGAMDRGETVEAKVTQEKKLEPLKKAAPPPAEPPPPAAPAADQPAPLEGPVSVANEPLNKVAEIIGLPRLETPLDGPYAWPQAWEDARAEFELNPRRGEELVKGMIARPRPPTPLEEVILLREGVTRTNAFNAAVEAQSKATESDQEAANQRVADAINALAEIQQASALMGTLSGRALNFRKMSAWMDFSLANMTTRLQGAKQKELTKEEVKDAQDTHKKITKIEEEIAKTAASAGAEAELTSIFEETFKEAMALSKKNANDLIIQSRSAAKQGKSLKDFLVEKREEARKRIRLRGNNLNMGLNPADLFDHAVIMASYIAEGVVSLAELTAKMIGDFGPNVEKHIPQIKKEADALLEAEQQVFDAPEAGTTKTYAEQLVESKGDDLSDRWVYNRVKEWLVEQGEAGLKKDTKVLLDEVFKVITKEVNEFDTSITEQQLRDMFSGYGKVKFPNPEAAAVKLRQMRRLELLLDKLERARAGVAPLRAGLQRDETTPEEREALRLLNQALKDLDIPHAPSGANIKTPLDAVKSRLKNSIEDLNKQIKDVKEGRGRTERPRKEVEYDDEAKGLEAQRDTLQKQLDEIDPPRPPTVEERVTARLKDLDKQIADLKAKVAAKDYKPKQNETPITEQIQVKSDERDALSQTLKELRIEAEGLPTLTQEEVNERAQRTLTRQIDELEKQIREKDFAPDASLKPEASPALFRLKTKVEALRKQRDQLKEDLGFRKKQKTDAELIDLAVAGLEKTIDKLNKQINEGDLSSKARPSKVPEVAKIKNLRAERDSLREEVQRLRKAKEDAAKDPVAEKIKADRKQLQRMIKGYEDRIAKGDFRKRPKIAKQYDDSLMQLEIDLDNIKAEWSRKVFEAHLASRPPLKRMLDTGGQVLNTSRAILTSFDLSAVLRQGGFIGLGNPFRAARNITPMLKAFASDDVAKASLKRLKQRDNWRNYVTAGLYIAETDQTKMSAQEEAFMSRWIDKIPKGYKGLFLGSIVRGSQRAYLTFLNNLRADTFDALVNQLQKGPTPTREEMESIAYYINTATGRGDLGKGAWNQAAVGLNTIFFAPRLVASRFQIIGGMPIFKATGRTKALVLQEYAKFLMGASIVYALAGLAQDDDDEPLELDPRSSDFLKVRYGDTRVDPLGGLIQATVFVSRIVAGEKKAASGKIVPIRDTFRLPNLFREVPKTDKVPYGGSNAADVVFAFGRTKFSPATGAVFDLVTGENVIGETVTPADVVMKMTIPMSFEEAAETLEAHGMPKGPALTVLMTFGAGVMTYNDRK